MKPYDLKLWNYSFWIPEHETKADRRPTHWSLAKERIEELVPDRRVCVQAGGNWGYWPYYLSEMFETVYTFEPDPRCFVCLTLNTQSRDNVIRIQSALGRARGFVDLERDTDTTGNQRVKPGGVIPTFSIDDLGLETCDLIYLDVEGKEEEAILGATATIRHHRPVVAFEETKKYESARKAVEWHNYKQIGQSGRDVFMGPV